MKGATLLICSILFSLMSIAQPVPMFHHFTTVDGLPSSQTYQVLQDKKGYLWFASDHGITRYNGYEFKTYTSADGLKDNTVFKIQVGHDNKIWMQTASNQLFYVKDEKIFPYKYNDRILKLSGTNVPQAFYVDSLEQVYFICSWIGEHKIDINGNVSVIISYNPKHTINKIYFHSTDSRRLIGSGNFVADVNLKTWLYYKLEDKRAFDSLYVASANTGHLCVTRLQHKILVSVSQRLYELKDSKLYFIKEFPAIISHLFADSENSLWIGTYSGLYNMDLETSADPVLYLEHDFISGMHEDNEHGKWITTVNDGVFYLPYRKIQSFLFKDENLSEPLCLSHDNKSIYTGFWSGRVAQFNAGNYKVIYDQPSSDNYLAKIFAESETGRIYISRTSPGYIYKERYYPLKMNIARSFKGGFVKRMNGDLINISVKHLFEIKDDSINVICAFNVRVNCIYETSEGQLLAGTNSGVYAIDEKNCNLIDFEPSLKEVRIDDISSLSNIICLATRGKGLILKRGNKVVSVTQADGLSSNLIHKTAVDRNVIWCASFNGISKIVVSEKDFSDFKITNISVPDGLPGNEINDIIVLNDTVWVAAKNSVSFFPAKSEFSNPIPPPVHFTAFKINNKPIDLNRTESIPYFSNTISIGFEGLSFRSAGKLQYDYLLIHDRDSFTSSTATRQVEFLSLKPGKYIFQVSSRNHSGTWSLQPATLEFRILAPFWQRAWFTALCIVLILSVIYIYFRIRIARVKKEEAMKADFSRQLVELEVKALRAQMNPHFIFNVMNSIQDYILKNDSRSAQKYLTRFARLVRLILDNSMVGEVVLSQELRAAELYIDLEQQRFDDKFIFNLTVDDEVEEDSLLIPSMILQPYLENAIKHGISHLKEKGAINVEVLTVNRQLLISIEDNGVGRSVAAEFNRKNVRDHVSYGSVITEDRIKAYNIAHNTSIQVKITDLVDPSGKASGTQVVLTIPVKYRS